MKQIKLKINIDDESIRKGEPLKFRETFQSCLKFYVGIFSSHDYLINFFQNKL